MKRERRFSASLWIGLFYRGCQCIAVLLLIGCGNAAYAQDSCEKSCLSKDSPCDGLKGREYAQCLGQCEKKCHPSPPPPPLLDPRCGDRTKVGKFTCTIDQPDVSHKEKEYPQVQFAPNDIVQVEADGCVQTGGHGDTWKRYVNPSGDGTNDKYHGMIRVPTAKPAGSGLLRIEKFIGKLQTVTGEGVPVSQLVLWLGYEDDDYSDNGYYSHDDGNDDQCKTSGSNYGGPAHVTITICRGTGVACGTPASRYDFDVLSGAADRNGLPDDPEWSWQQRNPGQIPSTSICHEFSQRGSVLGIPQLYMVPSFADCTDQVDPATSVDLPDGLNDALCKLRKGGPFASGSFVGHVNWFPVTVEGHAGPIDHNADDDYSFSFTSDTAGDPLSVNGRGGIHVEFDSDETIDNYSSPEWKLFHDSVDGRDSAKASLTNCDSGARPCTDAERAALQAAIDLPAKYFQGHTVLTGMFGMDGEHDLKAEMHPLYAMATSRDNYENDPSDDVWFMFVRNRGDEGFCSSQLWDSGFEDYTVRLPWRDGMTSVDVDWTKTQLDFEGTEGTSGPTVEVILPPSKDMGVYVSFHLGPASSTPFIDGALHLVWTGQALRNPGRTAVVGGVARGTRNFGVAGARSTAETQAEGVDEVEHSLQAAVRQLPPAQRELVQKARAIGSAHRVVHRLTAGGPVRIITALPGRPRMSRLHAIKAGPAVRKAQRDAAQIHALCAATNNAPAGLPVEMCKGTVRDHRTPPVVRDHR
jgi:hypothetical protein